MFSLEGASSGVNTGMPPCGGFSDIPQFPVVTQGSPPATRCLHSISPSPLVAKKAQNCFVEITSARNSKKTRGVGKMTNG